MLSLPETAPKIDFAAYKARITVPGMVEEFQKQYEALKVPYPADTVSSKVDEVQKQAVSCFCTSYTKESPTLAFMFCSIIFSFLTGLSSLMGPLFLASGSPS